MGGDVDLADAHMKAGAKQAGVQPLRYYHGDGHGGILLYRGLQGIVEAAHRQRIGARRQRLGKGDLENIQRVAAQFHIGAGNIGNAVQRSILAAHAVLGDIGRPPVIAGAVLDKLHDNIAGVHHLVDRHIQTGQPFGGLINHLKRRAHGSKNMHRRLQRIKQVADSDRVSARGQRLRKRQLEDIGGGPADFGIGTGDGHNFALGSRRVGNHVVGDVGCAPEFVDALFEKLHDDIAGVDNVIDGDVEARDGAGRLVADGKEGRYGVENLYRRLQGIKQIAHGDRVVARRQRLRKGQLENIGRCAANFRIGAGNGRNRTSASRLVSDHIIGDIGRAPELADTIFEKLHDDISVVNDIVDRYVETRQRPARQRRGILRSERNIGRRQCRVWLGHGIFCIERYVGTGRHAIQRGWGRLCTGNHKHREQDTCPEKNGQNPFHCAIIPFCCILSPGFDYVPF